MNLRVLSKDLDALLESYHDILNVYTSTDWPPAMVLSCTDVIQMKIGVAFPSSRSSVEFRRRWARSVNERMSCSHSMRLSKT